VRIRCAYTILNEKVASQLVKRTAYTAGLYMMFEYSLFPSTAPCENSRGRETITVLYGFTFKYYYGLKKRERDYNQ
jgi:hypothetical protein